MISTIKDAITTAMLAVAAIIGAVLMLTGVSTVTHHGAPTQQPAHTAATRVVPCLHYLSLGAMRSAADANIPAPVSFCASTEN